jgi:hypothetical protein
MIELKQQLFCGRVIMSRSKILVFLFISAIVLSIIIGFSLLIIPTSFYTQDISKFYIGLISTIIVSCISGIVVYSINKHLDRPVLKIEHVNFKLMREPYKLDNELWWYITKNEKYIQELDKKVSWKMTCFDKNEFHFYQLDGIKKLIEIYISKYTMTTVWAENMLKIIDNCLESKTRCDEEKESIYPYLYRFEDHYHSTFKSGIFDDLQKDTNKVLNFIKNEGDGLLRAHKKEIDDQKKILAWAEMGLKAGENKPTPIDYKDEKVPKMEVLIGISNVGRTPALLKGRGMIEFANKIVHIEQAENKEVFFSKIEQSQVIPYKYEVGTTKDGFENLKAIYELLINTNNRTKVMVSIELADGSYIQRKNIELIDDYMLPI